MRNLVIGCGEIGSAIREVLLCDAHDPSKGEIRDGEYDIIHICFPYSDKFIELVKEYQSKFKAKYTVIHATVPIGTCSQLEAVHSPVRGVHPHLYESVLTFTKYFGGDDAVTVSQEFLDRGIHCVCTDKPETTELMKLVDTSTYGLNILIEKEIHRLCERYDVPFDLVYTDANKTYNEGYIDTGMPQFQKYVLKHMDGKIGGHCVSENSLLLDTWLNDVIKEKNI